MKAANSEHIEEECANAVQEGRRRDFSSQEIPRGDRLCVASIGTPKR
jgi:hypothetical protein